jgi:anaerobic selenocysteine-containing dehydrogenase
MNTDARRTHYRACHLCEAICGLVIQTEGPQGDEKIVSIKGDPNDPLSRGHICPKAVALKDIHEDPDRLRRPIKRVMNEQGDANWEEISWDEALDTTAQRLVEITQRDGINALGIYLGNPTVHNYGMMTHQGNLFRHLRTDNRFSATSVDQLPHHLTSLWLFGHKSLFPIPDIDRTDYFLMLGANPIASNGSPRGPRRQAGGDRPPPHGNRATGQRASLHQPRHRRPVPAGRAQHHLQRRPGQAGPAGRLHHRPGRSGA